jgi:acyl-CoA thioester hydrolase
MPIALLSEASHPAALHHVLNSNPAGADYVRIDHVHAAPVLSSDLPLTFRGVVYPGHVDHMGHMNVQHYVGMFDQATWVLLSMLGLDSSYFREQRRGMAALEQCISYKRELLAGDLFEIRSAILHVHDKTIRFIHKMLKAGTPALAARTVILGVHMDTVARKSVPFPVELRERAKAFIHGYFSP